MFGRMRAKPGRRDELVQVLGRLADAVAGEPGCEVYSFWAADDDPDLVLAFEQYADEAALGAHFQNPALREVGGAVGDLLAEPASLTKAALAAGGR